MPKNSIFHLAKRKEQTRQEFSFDGETGGEKLGADKSIDFTHISDVKWNTELTPLTSFSNKSESSTEDMGNKDVKLSPRYIILQKRTRILFFSF